MRLVILTSRFPYPLDKGDKLRIYHQIRVLSEEFRIYLIALSDEPVNQDHVDVMKRYCAEVHICSLSRRRFFRDSITALLRGMPFQVAYFYEKSLVKVVGSMIERVQPTVVLCQLIRMAPYVPKRPRPYGTCIDYMDSFSLNLKTNRGHWLIPRWLERRLISRIEKDIFEKFDAHFIISERDRRACDPILASQIDVLANGVDCTFWSPLENIDASFDIAFCGNLGYRPNQLAVQYILNELVTADPGLTVIIGGAARHGQKTGRTQGRVTWTGWVDDLRTVYQNALVFVAPITAGSGIQNKVLEAMAQGLPCVVTPFVNEALGAVPDVEVLLADSPQDFLHHIRVLRKDPLLRRQIGTKARAFVQQNYDWRVNTQILVQKIKLSSPS